MAKKGRPARFSTEKVGFEFPKREERWLMEYVASKLYKQMIASGSGFPYDNTLNEFTGKPNTEDPRKKWGGSGRWHLREHGAAFLGGRQIEGNDYQGPTPHTRKNVVTWIWSMEKIYGKNKEKEIDYASYQDYAAVYPTYHDIEDAIDEALDDWWRRNYA